MIQFRWKPQPQLAGLPIGEAASNVVVVGGLPCVLEFKQHFMTTVQEIVVDDNGNTEAVIILAEARDCDKVWKDVPIA